MSLLNYFFINNLRKWKWCAAQLDLTSPTFWLISSSIYSVFQENFHHLSILYSKTCCMRSTPFMNWIATGPSAFGKQTGSNEWVGLIGSLFIDKITWLLYFICPAGIKDVRGTRRGGSITSKSQVTEISCVLKIIVNFCVWQRVPEEVIS